MTSKNKEFADNILLRISDDEEFSDAVLGRPLFTTSNTDPVFIYFLCHLRIAERNGEYFPYLSCTFAESERPILFQ